MLKCSRTLCHFITLYHAKSQCPAIWMPKLNQEGLKLKKLEDKAVDEEITAKFKSVHALAIEYAQAMADAGSFLSFTLVSLVICNSQTILCNN